MQSLRIYQRPLALALGLGVALTVLRLADAAPPASASAHYEESVRRFETNDVPGAIIQLKNLLQQDPNHLPSRVLLGRALLRSGDAAAAEKELRLARQLRADDSVVLLPLAQSLSAQRKYAELIADVPTERLPTSIQAEILTERAIAFLETGQLDAAEREFRRARENSPGLARASAGDTLVNLRRGDKQKAAEMADALVTKFPSSADAWVAKGNVEYASGKLRDAVASFDRAVALDPGAGNVQIVRASALLDLGDYQAAADALASLRKASARDPQINYLYAQALYKLGRSAEATKLMAEAAEVVGAAAPDVLGRHPPSLLLAGLILYGNRQYEQAYNLLNAYLQIDREHLEARKVVASTLIALKKPRDAVELLRPAMIRGITDPQIYAIAGEAYLRAGQHSRASEAFEQALALRPSDPGLRAQRGLARVAGGDRTRGIADIEAAVADHPGALGTSLYLAMLKLGDGDTTAAHDIAERVLERDSSNLTALNLLASAQLAKGNPAAARQSYEKALTLDPKFRPARINLARLELMEGRPDEAERQIAPLLAEDPQNPRLMYEMALVEEARQQPEAAIQWLEKAYAADRTSLTVAPRLADAYLRTSQPAKAMAVVTGLQQSHGETTVIAELMGRAQLASGAIDDARRTFTRLAVLAGYDTARLIRAAELQLQTGDHNGAWWSLEKAVAGDEGSLPARAGLGSLALALGKLSVAREQADQLMQRFPDHPAGHALKGDVAMTEGRFEDAVGPFRTALAKADTAGIAIRLMQAQIAAGQAKLAVTELAAWVVKHPDSLKAKRALAEAHHAAGDLLTAKSLYEELAEKTPNDAAVLNNLAEVYGTLGDIRSLEMAYRALALAPRDAAVIDTLGWALVRLGRPDEGLAYLRDAISRLATSGEIRYHLAIALEDLGRREEAIRELTSALEQNNLESRADAQRRLDRLKAATR